jgi:ankyrin repeat protein
VSDDTALRALIDAIVGRDPAQVSRLLAASPELATAAFGRGATRQTAEAFFLTEITHHCYQGDTALHIAAAAHDAATARDLVVRGADVSAPNRRRAHPMHYAVDGAPSWPGHPTAQRDTVACLIELGAPVDAVDANGSQPLHRAIRNRASDAVAVLLAAGADPNAASKKGSTPMQLAAWTTGKSGAGTPRAKAEQARIIELLLAAGARAT